MPNAEILNIGRRMGMPVKRCGRCGAEYLPADKLVVRDICPQIFCRGWLVYAYYLGAIESEYPPVVAGSVAPRIAAIAGTVA